MLAHRRTPRAAARASIMASSATMRRPLSIPISAAVRSARMAACEAGSAAVAASRWAHQRWLCAVDHAEARAARNATL